MSDFFDLDEEDIKIEIIDPEKLNDNARMIYDTYLIITGLKELPKSDYIHLNEAAKNYYISSFCRAMKETIAINKSFMKAKEEGRIKNFEYIKGFLNIISKTRINKINYEQKFENPEKFFEDNSSNEGFIVLNQYVEYGKISIISSEDTKDMFNIFSEYSPEEISEGIMESKDYHGNIVYNLKFLYHILKKIRSNNKRYEENWIEKSKEMKVNIENLFKERDYIEEETEEDKKYYNDISNKLIENIERFKV